MAGPVFSEKGTLKLKLCASTKFHVIKGQSKYTIVGTWTAYVIITAL